MSRSKRRSKRRVDVFISYSTLDGPLVEPLLALLRIKNRRVFRDADSIEKGERWEEAIERAIDECKVFVLFWCCHSAKSEFVAKEVERVQRRGDVAFIPAIFCDSPMPNDVGVYQGIDFRRVIHHECDDHGEKPEVKQPPAKRRFPNVSASTIFLILSALPLLGEVFYKKGETVKVPWLLLAVTGVCALIAFVLMLREARARFDPIKELVMSPAMMRIETSDAVFATLHERIEESL